MKAFLTLSSLLALAAADQSSHQAVKLGNAPAVRTAIHKPHGIPHAHVSSQPSAQPNEVLQYHNEEKYDATNAAPAHYVKTPGYHAPAPYHAPVYHAPVHHAPAYHAPVHHAPAYHAPVHAPAYHAPVHAPAYHAPAPAYHAPVHAPAYHAPAPVHKPAPHHPAPYHEPAYEGPAVYHYGYDVQDDYTGTYFSANEARDGYATNGEYKVALPDGRTQIVTYNVADDYAGYVADVRYEGKPVYHEPVHHAPAYHA